MLGGPQWLCKYALTDHLKASLTSSLNKLLFNTANLPKRGHTVLEGMPPKQLGEERTEESGVEFEAEPN
jgi:hypothetical protein